MKDIISYYIEGATQRFNWRFSCIWYCFQNRNANSSVFRQWCCTWCHCVAHSHFIIPIHHLYKHSCRYFHVNVVGQDFIGYPVCKHPVPLDTGIDLSNEFGSYVLSPDDQSVLPRKFSNFLFIYDLKIHIFSITS